MNIEIGKNLADTIGIVAMFITMAMLFWFLTRN